MTVRAMPEDDVPSYSVEPGTEHYYLEIITVCAFSTDRSVGRSVLTSCMRLGGDRTGLACVSDACRRERGLDVRELVHRD